MWSSSFWPVTVVEPCLTMLMRRMPSGCILSSLAAMSISCSTAKLTCGAPKAAHGPVEDVVGRYAVYVGMDVLYGIGPEALSGRAPGDPGRHRQVGAGIGVHGGLDRQHPALAGYAYLVAHLVRMALVAFPEGPLAVVGQLDRSAGQPGPECGPGADRSGGIVLAAEAAADRDGVHLDIGQGLPEQGRGEAAGAEGVLHAAVYLDDAVGPGHADRRFGFHVGLFYGLGLELLLEDQFAGVEDRIGVAMPQGMLDHDVAVAVGGHHRSIGLQGFVRWSGPA